MAISDGMKATGERESYYKEIAGSYLIPLWERIGAIAPQSPRPQARPACWRFSEVRPHLLKAGKLLSTEEAERRVLVLENPGLLGQSRAADSLYVGMQLLLPGEHAGAHRHTAAALRIILEGSGAYTSVNGERTTMERGDFVVTPSWTWHAHGNDTSEPMIWMDGLDVTIVNLFNASFFEHYPASDVPVSRPTGDSEARYTMGGMLPDKEALPSSLSSPLLNYRYGRARAALGDLYRNGPMDPCHGVKLRYVNPLTGGSPMPTMSASMQLIPAGFRTAPYRSTESTAFVAIEGEGQTHFDDQSFDWGKNDVVIVPSWTSFQISAKSEAVLFSFSDRTAQEKLGVWREHRTGDTR